MPIQKTGDDDIGSKNLANAERIINDKWRSNRPLLASTGYAHHSSVAVCGVANVLLMCLYAQVCARASAEIL